jgi:hypothetical protein
VYFYSNIIRMIKSGRMTGRACSKHGTEEECIHVFVRKLEGKKVQKNQQSCVLHTIVRTIQNLLRRKEISRKT